MTIVLPRNDAFYSVMEFGAVGDGRTVTDGVTMANNTLFISGSANFTTADVGKVVAASSIGLLANIVRVVSNEAVTLSAAPSVSAQGLSATIATDDTAAIQAALDTAGPNGHVFAPATTFCITDMIGVPTGLRLEGAGLHNTIFQQLSAGTPVIVTKDWPTAKQSASPFWSGVITGYTSFSDFSVQGASGVGAHGIVNRDFYTRTENVQVNNCGGHGFYLTPQNSSGTNVGSTLVEHHYDKCKVYACGTAASGYGFFIGEGSNGKTTDGFITNCIVDSGSGSQPSGHVYVGAAGGWKLDGIHTYGLVSASSVKIVNGYRTRLRGLYIETYWQAGIYINLAQESVWVTDCFVGRSQTNASAAAVLIDGQATYSPIVWVQNLCVKNENGGTALVAISNSNSPVTPTVLAPGLKTIGTNITNTGGGGSASITLPY